MYSKGGNNLETQSKFSLSAARHNVGLSQSEMADLLGISLPTYVSYEHGKTLMRVDTADKFSKIVKIPKQQIVFF